MKRWLRELEVLVEGADDDFCELEALTQLDRLAVVVEAEDKDVSLGERVGLAEAKRRASCHHRIPQDALEMLFTIHVGVGKDGMS